MTRKEAIAYFKDMNECTYGDVEPIQMAISALEQEPKTGGDCISRQALIERINNAEENFKADNMDSITSDDGDPFVDGVLSGVFNIRQMVIQAPSVMPKQEPKTDILDKVKAEIIENSIEDYKYHGCGTDELIIETSEVLKIIDKHRQEG